MNILLVDDAEANLEMLRFALEKHGGYTLYEAANARVGFELLQKHHIQLAAIDWMMPEMDGLTMVNHIRELFTDYYIYIIMITAKDGRDAMLEGLESGVDDFIQRPFSPRELRARIKIGERIIESENALQRSREQVAIAKQEWESTADAVPQLMCLVDRDGRILRANRTIERWNLLPVHEAKGKLFTDALANIYTDFAQQIMTAWKDATSRLASGLSYDFMGEDRELERYFEVHFQPIVRRADVSLHEDSYAAVSVHDITARRKLELALEAEHEKSERLLLNILPAPVSQQLKNGEMIIAEEYSAASILFADLVGFTAFAARIPPAKLIGMLNDIFSRFDTLTEKHGLEKIKTVGDAYMAVSGVPVAKTAHAAAAVNMGLDILEAMQAFNATHKLDLQIRVGIHTGAVVAGVIGAKKFAYDMWGDTVNTASRMEAAGAAGQVHISETTAKLLPKDAYALTLREPVSVKGKGQMQTYFVNRRASQETGRQS
jgi:adenylate cyclase